ncbi:hypothetical protein [Cetobacterium ceti]
MNYYKILLYCNFYFPLFINYFGTNGTIIFNLLILVVLSYKIFHLRKIEYDLDLVIIFCGLGFLYLVAPFFNAESILHDYLQIYKPILFFLAYLLGRNIEKKNIYKILNILENIYIWQILVVLIYIYMPDGYNKIAIFNTKSDNIYRIRRLVGTFSNPYDYAYYLNFMISYFLFKFNFYKRKKYLLLIILGIINIFYSLSRTGLIILGLNILGVLIYKLFSIKKYKIKNIFKILVKLNLIIVIFFICASKVKDYMYYKFPYIYFGFYSLFYKGIKNTRSIAVRFEQYKYFDEVIEKNIFIGLGPCSTRNIYTESMYLLYLFRYGLLGFLYVLYLIYKGFYNSILAYRRMKKNINIKILILTFGLLNITNIISFFTNNYIDQVRNNTMYYLILGLISKLAKNKKK